MKNKSTGNRFLLVGKWVLKVLLAQVVLINISAAIHAYRFTHYYDHDKVRNIKSSVDKPLLRTWRLMTGRKLPKSLITNYPVFPYDTVLLTTKNGIKIEAWYIKTDSAKGTVILFHGLNSNKGKILNEAFQFLSWGYNTMLVDIRAHGNSEGIINSIGYRESEEVKLAYSYINQQGGKNIILWGMSLGAVIITKAIAEYDLQPQKIILDMPFDRLQDHIKARARVLGFPDEPFGFFVSFWSGVEQGYWSFTHRTSRYAKKINCPVLLQWGDHDAYVMRKETENIYASINSEQKELVVYPQAGHIPLLSADAERWKTTVNDFLTRN